MELLAEISDLDFGLERETSEIKYKMRKASRAVIINHSNEVALLFVSKNNYHKLPGGGIEQGEDISEALIREVIEEVGVEIKLITEVGAIIEYRDQFELLQLSYCYVAEVEKLLENPSFTEEEVSNGFILKWVPIEEAINLLRDDQPRDYMGKFIQKRDYTFLLKSKECCRITSNE